MQNANVKFMRALFDIEGRYSLQPPELVVNDNFDTLLSLLEPLPVVAADAEHRFRLQCSASSKE